jgi:hypothetical protein
MLGPWDTGISDNQNDGPPRRPGTRIIHQMMQKSPPLCVTVGHSTLFFSVLQKFFKNTTTVLCAFLREESGLGLPGQAPIRILWGMNGLLGVTQLCSGVQVIYLCRHVSSRGGGEGQLNLRFCVFCFCILGKWLGRHELLWTFFDPSVSGLKPMKVCKKLQ